MMKIKNPIDNDITLIYNGTKYFLGAGITDSFEADVVARWIEIYGFIQIVSNSAKETDKVVDEIIKGKEEKEIKIKK